MAVVATMAMRSARGKSRSGRRISSAELPSSSKPRYAKKIREAALATPLSPAGISRKSVPGHHGSPTTMTNSKPATSTTVSAMARPIELSTPAASSTASPPMSTRAFAVTGVAVRCARYPPKPSATVAAARRSASNMSHPATNPTVGPNASAAHWHSGEALGRSRANRAYESAVNAAATPASTNASHSAPPARPDAGATRAYTPAPRMTPMPVSETRQTPSERRNAPGERRVSVASRLLFMPAPCPAAIPAASLPDELTDARGEGRRHEGLGEEVGCTRAERGGPHRRRGKARHHDGRCRRRRGQRAAHDVEPVAIGQAKVGDHERERLAPEGAERVRP